ncbi:hypothetical protein QF001_003990 [Paraburkholderia youngii]
MLIHMTIRVADRSGLLLCLALHDSDAQFAEYVLVRRFDIDATSGI